MNEYTASHARQNLSKIIDEACGNNIQVLISGKRNKAVLMSEEYWKSMQETLYLLSIPGLRESLIEGKNEPIEKCSNKLKW